MNALIWTYCLIVLVTPISSYAQKKKHKQKPISETEAKPITIKKSGKNLIVDKTKGHAVMHGLFTFYQDSTSGSVKMKIDSAQLDQEFIHFYYIENGVAEVGAFRGNFRGSQIFTIRKYFDRLEFVRENTSAYYDSLSPLAKVDPANMSRSILFSTKIVAKDSGDQAFLINADGLFKKEVFGFIKYPQLGKPNPLAFSLGRLSKEKTKYLQIKAYEANSDVRVEYVYENSSPKKLSSPGVTDARNVSIVAHHSLIKMPYNGYKPRYDDPRVGYFTTQTNDFTSLSATPYRDMIHRWDLRKKNPSAAISEPVKPIVFWMEKTTPKEIRPIIKKAGLQWNRAFEKAGFKDAIQIKQQPDSASWDAGDIRYNVLRWVSSPRRIFRGYGPSFVNPRTGQILGADIILEFSALGYQVFNKTFDKAGVYREWDHAPREYKLNCDLSAHLEGGIQFGHLSMGLKAASLDSISEVTEQFIYFLILHEIGHTLGLNHNMKSSNLHDPVTVHDRSVTLVSGLTGSVMDYPAINLAPIGKEQGHYYSMTPGPYDLWAIEFGYRPTDSLGLTKILDRSTEPELIFGNDADDMRAPGKGIDPRVNIGDMSNDAITYSLERILLCRKVLKELKSRVVETGDTYQELFNAFFIVGSQLNSAYQTISRFVGGVYVDRALHEQKGQTRPFIPVEASKQKRAMKSLGQYLFAPNAFETSEELLSHLQKQRRGFNHFFSNEDPKVHQWFLYLQKSVLAHLLHRSVLQRIVESEAYGNTYSISEVMTEMNKNIFDEDRYTKVNTFRQNLQVYYTEQLIKIFNSKSYCTQAKSMALVNLNTIRKITRVKSIDMLTNAHRLHLAHLIDKALDTH